MSPVQADSLDRLALVYPVRLFPVFHCPDCRGDRPHYATDVAAICQACGRMET